MDVYEFLGLPQSQWQFINTFADWLSALGTLAAVGFSAWVTLRASRPQAKLTANVWLTIGGDAPQTESVGLRIVNTGERPIVVVAVAWRVGFFKKHHAMQKTDGPPPGLFNSPLPITLTHGEMADWYVDAKRLWQGETWYQHFAARMIVPNTASRLRTLRALAYTSTGHVIVAKPSGDVLEKLRAAAATVAPA